MPYLPLISLTLHPCRRPLITFTDMEDPNDREAAFIQNSKRLMISQSRGNQTSPAYTKQMANFEI